MQTACARSHSPCARIKKYVVNIRAFPALSPSFGGLRFARGIHHKERKVSSVIQHKRAMQVTLLQHQYCLIKIMPLKCPAEEKLSRNLQWHWFSKTFPPLHPSFKSAPVSRPRHRSVSLGIAWRPIRWAIFQTTRLYITLSWKPQCTVSLN